MACCKKKYVTPTFNILCAVQTGHIGPPTPAPMRLIHVPCFLQFGSFQAPIGFQAGGFGAIIKQMYLGCPPLTDLRSSVNAMNPDYVEVPEGSGRWYICGFVDDVWKGFPTEHRVALLTWVTTAGYPWSPFWPVPMP